MGNCWAEQAELYPLDEHSCSKISSPLIYALSSEQENQQNPVEEAILERLQQQGESLNLRPLEQALWEQKTEQEPGWVKAARNEASPFPKLKYSLDVEFPVRKLRKQKEFLSPHESLNQKRGPIILGRQEERDHEIEAGARKVSDRRMVSLHPKIYLTERAPDRIEESRP